MLSFFYKTDYSSTDPYSTTLSNREKGKNGLSNYIFFQSDDSKSILRIIFLCEKVPYFIRVPEIKPVPIIMKELHPYPVERKVKQTLTFLSAFFV